MDTNNAPFAPSPSVAAAVIADFTSGHLTLAGLARTYRTTLSALAAWVLSPPVAAQLDAIEAASVRHLRVAAAAELPVISRLVSTLTRSIDLKQLENTPATQNLPVREHARRLVGLLFKACRFNLAGAPSTTAATPTPRRARTASTAPTTSAAPAAWAPDSEPATDSTTNSTTDSANDSTPKSAPAPNPAPASPSPTSLSSSSSLSAATSSPSSPSAPSAFAPFPLPLPTSPVAGLLSAAGAPLHRSHAGVPRTGFSLSSPILPAARAAHQPLSPAPPRSQKNSKKPKSRR